MSGLSKPLQAGQAGSIPLANTAHALDSREDKPSSWDEVQLLQEALGPSLRSFTRINSRTPPSVPGSLWLSYAEQLEMLQRESDRCWSVDRRTGVPPKLAKLGQWRGGIRMVSTAEFRITEDMTKGSIHENLVTYSPRDGSPGWYQNTFSEQMHKEAQKILAAADARRARLTAQDMDIEEQQDISDSLTEMLDQIVAQDPERYLAWLSTMGYYYFKTDIHNPHNFSWEDWCKWKAPERFELCMQVSVAGKPPLDTGAIDSTNSTRYGPPGERPFVTLEEAKRGSKRAMKSRNAVDEMKTSLREEAEYYTIGGQSRSREAAAHYHAIRGEDVWLYEPQLSSKEAQSDPSRQREAEIEASFDC